MKFIHQQIYEKMNDLIFMKIQTKITIRNNFMNIQFVKTKVSQNIQQRKDYRSTRSFLCCQWRHIAVQSRQKKVWDKKASPSRSYTAYLYYNGQNYYKRTFSLGTELYKIILTNAINEHIILMIILTVVRVAKVRTVEDPQARWKPTDFPFGWVYKI